MRRKDHPSRPKVIICCLLSSLNTLLMALVRIPVIVNSDSGANVSMIPAHREQRYGSS
jgi:hypothetical protein